VRRRTSLVTAVAATALLAAGCGLTDNAVQPGLAAKVDGETLSLRKVDRAVQDYCALRAANKQATTAPTALVRAQFVTGWTQAVAVDHLAPEHGVALPPARIDRATVEAAWGELGTIDDDNYASFEWLTWIQQRLTSPVEQLGAPATGDQAVQRGIELITGWLDDQHVELNPVFGDYDAKTAVFSGDALSVPVSAEAKAAQQTAQLTPDQIAKLPADQRCGPAVVQAPQGVPQG
jgi:hypothetical protein